MMVNSKAWFGGLTQTPWDCETVGWVSCSVIRYRPCLSFLTHTVYTHRPSPHKDIVLGGGQIWIWRMGTIGDNLQKFKKFLKNCHKMFRGMVEPDKSLISTLAFLSSCSCQFRHPANFVAFENLDNLYSFCSLLKILKLLAILKMLKN